MKGFPKHLNTKQDYLNLLPLFPEQTKAELQRLLDERIGWVTTSRLNDGDEGLTDETHRVDALEDDTGTVTERYQVQYMEDPAAELFRVGFTVEEVEGLING
jgi:hypothetical protein